MKIHFFIWEVINLNRFKQTLLYLTLHLREEFKGSRSTHLDAKTFIDAQRRNFCVDAHKQAYIHSTFCSLMQQLMRSNSSAFYFSYTSAVFANIHFNTLPTRVDHSASLLSRTMRGSDTPHSKALEGTKPAVHGAVTNENRI